MNHLTSGGLSQDFSGSGQNWVTAKTKFESGGGGGGGRSQRSSIGSNYFGVSQIDSVHAVYFTCMYP